MADLTAPIVVNPPLGSKINWTAVAQIIASIGVYFGVDLPPAELATALVAINVVAGALIGIFRTWFTGSTASTGDLREAIADKKANR